MKHWYRDTVFSHIAQPYVMALLIGWFQLKNVNINKPWNRSLLSKGSLVNQLHQKDHFG